MKTFAAHLLSMVFMCSLVSAKEWIFTGTIRDTPVISSNPATVLVRINTEVIALNEIRLIYNSIDGTIDAERACWMGKPMPRLLCPKKIPALITSKPGRKCRLVFESERWDMNAKFTNKIALKSLEWISDDVQSGRDTTDSPPSK